MLQMIKSICATWAMPIMTSDYTGKLEGQIDYKNIDLLAYFCHVHCALGNALKVHLDKTVSLMKCWFDNFEEMTMGFSLKAAWVCGKMK